MRWVNLKGLFLVLFKRPKRILLISIVTVALSFLISKILFTDYVARARVLVKTDIIGETKAEDTELIYNRTMNTIIELIRNRSIVEDVVKELNLEAAYPNKKDIVEDVLSSISVRPLQGTEIIVISVRNKKPELACQIANTICKVLIVDSAKERFSFQKDILSWLSDEAAKIRKDMEASRQSLEDFKRSSGIIDAEMDYKNTQEQLLKLEYEINGVRAEKQSLEAEYTQIQQLLKSGKDIDQLPQVLENVKYNDTLVSYNENRSKIEELSKTYQPNHPEIARLIKENSYLKRSMARLAAEIVDNIELRYKTAAGKEEKLEKLMDEKKKALPILSERLSEYNSYLNTLVEKEKIYNAFLEKINKDVVGGLRIQQVSLVEQAYLPRRKDEPPLFIVLLIGLLLGFIITGVYNSVKEKGTLFIEKGRPQPAKEKGMYIEKIKEEKEQEL